MSRGLGKIEKAVLKAACRCYFAKDLILDGGKEYKYLGGVRMISPDTKKYFRGISIGHKQHRMLLNDEKLIDLKEVHHFFKMKFGKRSRLYEDLIHHGLEKASDSIKVAEETARTYCEFMGIKQAEKKLSLKQEASYQRALKSLKKKGYFLDGNFGYAPNRFVIINEKKIRPIKPTV